MPFKRIAQNRRYRGIYPGEFFGSIFLGKNINLNRSEGKLVLGDSMSKVLDSTDDADLETPVQFVKTDADNTNRWWAITGGKLFKTDSGDPEDNWTQDAIASSPANPTDDGIEFLGDLYVSIDDDVDQLSGGTWTNDWFSGLTGASALTSGVPHRFEIFAGALLITDGRFINWYDGTLLEDPGLTLPLQFEAQWIKKTADFAVIGTKTDDGSEAEVFFWDRVSNVFNSRFGIGDTEALAGFVVSGIPHVITKKGYIKRFTGQGFRTVAEFPTAELGKEVTDINPNGITQEGDRVLINVSFGTDTGLRLLSGVWEFNASNFNLTHKFSPSNGNDYSQQELKAVGAIRYTQPSDGLFLCGADVYTDYSGTSKAGIFTSDETSTSGQRGYILTPKITANSPSEFKKQIILTLKELENSSDVIRILYRTQEDSLTPTYETITWTSTTTFTGSNNDVEVGNFVEVIGGNNGGALAKITDIQSGTPNTYTIDKTLTASSGDARVRYLVFEDTGEFSTQNEQQLNRDLNINSPWIQFLIELRGTVTSPEIEDIIIQTDNKEKS